MKMKRVPKLKRSTPIKERELEVRAAKLAKLIGSKLKVDFINAKATTEGVEYLSTGFQEIDDALSGRRDENMEIVPGSGKGFPRGRIVEIYGPEASAKTSLSLALIAEAQRRGELCAFIDIEHALDPQYAERAMGVDMNSLMWTQPDDGEAGLNVLRECVEQGVSVIVLDSVAALVSTAELKGGKALGEQARLMSSTCRKLTSFLKPGGPIVIFLNQIRYKIGIAFGNPEFTSGGNALKFYSSVRVEVRKKKELKKAGSEKGEPVTIGTRIKMRVVKNKVAPMGGLCLFDVMFGKGIRVPKLRSLKGAGLDDEPGSDE